MFVNSCSYSLRPQRKYKHLPLLKQDSIAELFRLEFILTVRNFYVVCSLLVTISILIFKVYSL